MNYCYKYNAGLECSLTHFFSDCDKMIKTNYDNNVSLLLLGSLSRGEGTWITSENGSVVMVSDIEFYAIVGQNITNHERFARDVQELSTKSLDGYLSDSFHIDISFMTLEKIKTAERKLLVFDASVFGRIVAGKSVELQYPEITADNINRFDIREIASHRAYAVLTANMSSESEYRYVLAKNTLDLMIIILVSYGQIESGFIRRCKAILKIDIPEKYKQFFQYCLQIKLGEDTAAKYDIEQMRMLFLEINEYSRAGLTISLENIWINRNKVFRRLLGIMKRAVHRGTITMPTKHYKTLMQILHGHSFMDKTIRLHHFILYGYPVNESN